MCVSSRLGCSKLVSVAANNVGNARIAAVIYFELSLAQHILK